MAITRIFAIEALMHQHETCTSRHWLEAYRDLGLTAAHSILLFPRPGEGQSLWRLDDMIEAAHHKLAATGTTQDNAPAPARSHVQIMNRGLVPVRGPPSGDLFWFDPQREKIIGR